MKPRASMAPQASSVAPMNTSRRKSIGASGAPRPPSALDDSAEAIAQLQAAMKSNNPHSYSGLGVGSRRPPSRSATPASPVRSRPYTPAQVSPSAQRTTTVSADASDSAFQLGDVIKAVGHEGILRYLGSIDGKNGMFAGIELLGASRGKGKNDGSVDGKAYFTCDALCGLFVPSSKIELVFRRPATPPFSTSAALPRPPAVTPTRLTGAPKSSAEAARAMEAKISQGSRASKYLGVTAAQLASKQNALKASSPVRRPASPQKKPGTPLSASATTPRPKPRTSGALPAPRSVSYSGRKSIGGAGSTPRSPTKRPSSALDRNTPEVPPIPASYASARPPSAAARRTSDALGSNPFSSPSSSSRPETPSRSFSRTSQASRGLYHPSRPGSVLSQSGASSVADDDRDWEALQMEKQAAYKRAEDAKVAQLEAEKSVKLSAGRFEEMRLRLESSDGRIKELEALMAASKAADGEATRLQRQAEERLRDLESRLQSATVERDGLQAAQVAANRASADGDELLKAKLDQAESAFASERKQLNAELEQLREAGNALCGVYEERLVAAAEARRGIENALAATEAELAAARSASISTNGASLGDSTGRTALAIDNETLRGEVDHLRGRIGVLEDNLEEARHNLEQEAQAHRQRRHESGETATTMKNEVKHLKERLESSAQREARSASRVNELEAALGESHRTLEVERAELESLRAEATSTASAETMQKQLDSLRRERDTARTEVKTLQGRLSDAEEELRLTEELRQGENSPLSMRSGLAVNGDTTPIRHKNLTSPAGHDQPSLRAQHERELQARDAEIRTLRARLDDRRLSDNSTLSGRSLTSPSGKDEASLVRDQIAGLKVIITQLTDENAHLAAANKQLKRDHDAGGSVQGSNGSDEVASLRRRLDEAERQSKREVQALHQEVADLEALVEAKIFKEDELTDEISRLKRDIRRLQQSPDEARTASKKSTGSDDIANRSLTCVMCEGPHSMDDCPILAGGSSSSSDVLGQSDFCTNCHEFGHSSDTCSGVSETF